MDLLFATLLVLAAVVVISGVAAGFALLARKFSHPEHHHAVFHKKGKHGTIIFRR